MNWLGDHLVSRLNWPVWLDSVGTVLCACLYGPVCGAIVGATFNLLGWIIYEYSWLYVIVSVVIAIIVGIAEKRKKLNTLLDTLTTGAFLAAVVAAVAYPINLLTSGSTGNRWGDAVIGYLREMGIPNWAGLLVGELYVELLDKLLILIAMYIILKTGRFILKLIRSRKKDDDESKDITPVRIASLLLAAAVGISALGGLIGSVRAEEPAAEGAASVQAAGSSILESTSAKVDYNNYVKTVYSTFNGLPCGKANDIAMTDDGILWIGTYAGLYRYNGRDFRQMNDYESVRNVNCLYVDEEGRLWIGTNDNGLSIMINEKIVNVIDRDRGLPSNSVKSIIKSNDGYYYIGTTAGTQVLTLNTGLKRIGIISEITGAVSFAADKKGNVAAISGNGTLYLLRQGKVINSKRRLEGKPVYTTCAFEPDGTLLVATEGNNIHHFRIDGDSFLELGYKDCKGLKNIKTLLRLDNGELFVCADNGIAHTNASDICDFPADDKVNAADSAENLGLRISHNIFDRLAFFRGYEQIIIDDFNNSIDNMLVDYQGNLWFTSSRLGLLRLAPSDFRDLYSGIRGMENQVVNAVVCWNGNYYIGTDKGMNAVDAEGRNQITDGDAAIDALPTSRIRCMIVDRDNNLWACTYTGDNGLVEIKPDGTVHLFNLANGQFENKARVVTQLADGTIAAGGNKNLSFFRRKPVISKNDTVEDRVKARLRFFDWEYAADGDAMHIGIILSIAQLKDGTILAGTDGDGLAVIKDYSLQNILTRKNGLSSEVILRVIPDPVPENGGAYIVTSNGLCYMDENREVRQLTKFPYYNNYDIWMKDERTLLVLSSAGIYIVDRNELLGGGNNLTYDLLDVRRGLNASLTPNAWIWFDEEKEDLYLPCDTGVYVLNTAAQASGTQYFRMNVSGIKAGDITYRADRNSTVMIPRKESRIEIQPEVINYSIQDPNVGYMLEGFDEDWTVVPQNSLGTIVYSNLPTGDYIFHLAVFDSQDNIISERTYPVSREKEMYDNNWFIFYILSVPMFTVFWVTWLLLKRHEQKVKAQLAEANRQVEMGKQTVRAIAKAVDAKDVRTGGHSTRVALYSGQIAKAYGMDEKQCREIEWAAQLHDIGKIAIPDAILNKDSRLTDEEYAKMKSHTLEGAEILKDFTLLDHVTEGALYHHERPDGRGYPQGLKGEDIPLYARIIGVADAFDAMTANRVYRKQMDFGYVLGELEKGRGTQFASEFVDILLNLIKTNVIDLNELYGIKPEDSQQAIEAAKPAESGTEKAADGSGTTADASASGEGGKS